MRASFACARVFIYPQTQSKRLIQGAPCAGGVPPPRDIQTSRGAYDGVQAEPEGSPKPMKNTLFVSFEEKENSR